MATYPQRWLREHKAVTSADGWRRPTNNELLKSEKGLVVGVLPKLTSIAITSDQESISVSENPYELVIDFVITEVAYEPQYIKLVSTKSENAVITYSVDTETKKITATITGMVKDEILTFKVESDALTSNDITYVVIQAEE